MNTAIILRDEICFTFINYETFQIRKKIEICYQIHVILISKENSQKGKKLEEREKKRFKTAK